MIYVPNSQDYKCIVVSNATTLRAYLQTPQRGTTVSYHDYYYNSHYTHATGTQTFSTNSTLPNCINSQEITSEVYYRNDFDSILIIFLIMCIFILYLPLKIFSKLFKRGGL